MDTSTAFKWRHFQAESILLCVRWYLRYPLSYRDLEEMMLELPKLNRNVRVRISSVRLRFLQHNPVCVLVLDRLSSQYSLHQLC